MARQGQGDGMTRGIGIDMVMISEIRGLVERTGEGFVTRTFTPAEVKASLSVHDRAEYLATRFAVKEATFKAVAPRTAEGFDLRVVETLNAPDGHPYVVVDERLRPALDEAGVTGLLVSITTEGDYAVAIVLAEG